MNLGKHRSKFKRQPIVLLVRSLILVESGRRNQLKCFIGTTGVDYPEPIVNHHEESMRNKERMTKYREELAGSIPSHCLFSVTGVAPLYHIPNQCLPMAVDSLYVEAKERLP